MTIILRRLRSASTRLLFPIFPIALLAACGGEGGGGREWAGTIDTLANGRVAVSNPERGVWKEGEEWRLVEEVRIGSADEAGPALFGGVRDVTADALGRIWVLEGQAQELRVFDAAGAHVRTVGRQGGGPGEFGQVGGVAWAPDGTLWVYDPGNMRFTVLDTAGTLVTSHRRDQGIFFMPWNGGFDAAGRFYDLGGMPTPGDFQLTLNRYDAAMKPDGALKLPKYQQPTYELRRGDMMMMASVPYSPDQVWTRARDGGIWIGIADRYAFHHVGFGGDTTRTVTREFRPVPVSRAERDERVEGLGDFVGQGGRVDAGRIPAVKPAYRAIAEDDQGYLWVRPSVAEGEADAVDVFDPQGRYLGRVAAAGETEIDEIHEIRGSHLYAVVRDENDVEYVVRYRIQGRR